MDCDLVAMVVLVRGSAKMEMDCCLSNLCVFLSHDLDIYLHFFLFDPSLLFASQGIEPRASAISIDLILQSILSLSLFGCIPSACIKEQTSLGHD